MTRLASYHPAIRCDAPHQNAQDRVALPMGQQSVDPLPWGHDILIVSKCGMVARGRVCPPVFFRQVERKYSGASLAASSPARTVRRITPGLSDGVKVKCGKFGDSLDRAKVITGGRIK